ncbi:hypothetical protein SAMN04487911_108110 [Arenibacter nanhaiticus]|uniref:BlaR1 peptidase M56 n=1 Tax=Arenibacter nanhaiticus TaxID=558155 RepID=A0A1M6FFA3_9FLAO|nr:hypothetical protein SAMN04487911_108110 [Arenibacter nanhaiticus]
MIIVFKYFFYKDYIGLALWPFIIVKNRALKKDLVLLNHERIHLKQQSELLLVLFYVIYVFEGFLKLLIYFDRYKAYRNISFEREAYQNEKNLNYLKERRPFSFIKYLWV